jgi:hypothetical protein
MGGGLVPGESFVKESGGGTRLEGGFEHSSAKTDKGK